MGTQLPLANLALGNIIQHTLHERAKIRKDTEHGTLRPLRRVGGVRRSREVTIRLRRAQVVDGVVGDRVRDDMALFGFGLCGS